MGDYFRAEDMQMRKPLLLLTTVVLCFAGCKQGQKLVNNSPAPGVIITPEQDQNLVFYIEEGGRFELPVAGASGYAAIVLPLQETANQPANVIKTLTAGQGFTILREENDWWYIEVNNIRGWIYNKLCMINIPDIIPSIVHNNTNTYSSMFRSSGIDIPNITGRALYQSKDFNARLGREEYIAVVLYPMAKKIMAAQQAALANGNTLVIYEAFRPSAAHDLVHEHFENLANTNPQVRRGITTPPWNIRWFLAVAPYNHQRGTAIDVTLARIDQHVLRATGNHSFIHITEYTEYEMHSPMHELSIASVVFRDAVHSRSETAWRDTEFAYNVTIGTIMLHKYLTEAGLTPLASEWWHFNDLEHTNFNDTENVCKYFIEKTFSIPPDTANARSEQ